ncbi:sugar ABC transporter substrate-binding protein [Breznakiella homolactica]|uniref:Sugar ABC transporter substrate-binding protein n=2 Tax=Breznakiella homolactica TaxID=2798577 RepID=A0A7T8BDK6_9SPIR|nr:sugar ABC transporter substrate-binding protein [Breznakiella homolactica]
MKNTALAVLMILITAVVFAGGGNDSGGTSGGTVTIQVANWDTANMPYVPVLIQAFETANPGVKVEIVDIPSADYNQKLTVMLNGGSDVDAFWIKEADMAKSFNNRGQLMDLTANIRRDGINLNDFNGLAENFVFDEKTVALPARTDYYIMYYNKDIFDAAGVAYPSNNMTWPEWEQLAARVTSGSGNTKKYGGFLHTWQACVQNWAVQDGKHTIMETDYSFFKPYYEMAIRMQDAGTIWDFGTLKTAGIHYSSAFLQGNVAMMPMGTWFFSTIIDRINKGESKVRWGISVLPHPAGVEAGWTVGSTTPMAVNNASKKKDAAWEFVKFVTGPEGAKIYAAGGSLPARSNSQTLADIANAPGMPEGSLDALQVKHISLDRPVADLVADVNNMLGEEHSLIMLKQVSIDQGLQNMARRSKQIQNK